MKKTAYIVIGLFIVLQWGCRFDELYVCSPDFIAFERSYAYEADTFSVKDMIPTPDGAFVICGNIEDDVFLLKIDTEGNTVFFERDQIPLSKETCNSIVMTADNGFVTCGKQNDKAYLSKYNAQGKHQNQNTQAQVSDCKCITDAGNGQYVISGSILRNNGVANTYAAPVRFNNTFPEIMAGYSPVLARDNMEVAQAVISASGESTVVGVSYSPTPGGGSSAHFYRLNNSLNVIPDSEKFHPLSSQVDIAYDLIETSEGNYMLAGTLQATDTDNDIFVLEMNKKGEILHQYDYGGNREDIAFSISHAHQSGEYIIVGYSTSFGTGSDDIYVSKINQNGSLVWEKTFGQSGVDERANAVLPTGDCGYIIAGQSTTNGLSRPYIIKINENGNIR